MKVYGVRNNVLSARVITPITHGNVRSKNILVDDFFVARLTEFGLDKLMKLLHFPKLKVARHLNYRG